MVKITTGKSVIFASLIAIALTGTANAQRDATERSINNELNRERAETRIERLKQDQREREERSSPRAQSKPPYGSTKKPTQPQR